MASGSISGTVTGKADQPAVTLKTFENGDQIAVFSVADLEYVYAKPGEDRPPQFYRVEVRGKAAPIIAERLERGSRVTAHGQLVQREYNGKTYIDLKYARVIFMDRRQEENTAPKRQEAALPF